VCSSDLNFSIADYESLKRHVLEEGKEEKEVRDVYRSMLKTIKENDPEEARKTRRVQYVRRLIGTLHSIAKEASLNKFLPGPLLRELEAVIGKIESEFAGRQES
jgi:hydrogenase maturation factor HypE